MNASVICPNNSAEDLNQTSQCFAAVAELNLNFSLTLRVYVSVLCLLILVVGTTGNLLVPIVVWFNREMRNSTNVFLVNLSVADLLVLIICVPTVLVEINSRPETWVLGSTMCKIVPFLESTVAHGSALTILAISFERYYAICQPLRAGYKCTKTRALIIILVVWTISVIITSPVIITTEYLQAEYIDGSTVPICLTFAQTQWRKGYFMAMQVIFFLIPLVILIVVYIIITDQLMKNVSLNHTSPRNSQKNVKSDHGSLKARRQVIATLAAVVISFFVCLFPMKVFQSWVILSKREQIQKLGPNSYFSLLFSFRMMLYVNSAVNPILYNVISSKFREAFIRQIHCRSGALRRRNTTSMTSSTMTGHSNYREGSEMGRNYIQMTKLHENNI